MNNGLKALIFIIALTLYIIAFCKNVETTLNADTIIKDKMFVYHHVLYEVKAKAI